MLIIFRRTCLYHVHMHVELTASSL